jgi:hypothetical protein
MHEYLSTQLSRANNSLLGRNDKFEIFSREGALTMTLTGRRIHKTATTSREYKVMLARL